MNDPTEQKLDRYFKQREDEFPLVSFDAVFRTTFDDRSKRYKVTTSILALAAGLAGVMIIQNTTVPPTLSEEFMTRVRWHTAMDRYLEYSTINYYRELPTFYKENEHED